MPSASDRRPAGLRERKKARTRASIQSHALRLFKQQGYHATTIEQIIAAAEVSESTLFRYFPTKEDLVLSDDNDPIIIAAFQRNLEQQMSPIAAVRVAVRELFADLTPAQQAEQRERMALILAVPSLRARVLDQLFDAMRMIADILAQHKQRPADDIGVRTTAGAIVGAMIAVLPMATDHPELDFVVLIDEVFAHLEASMPAAAGG
jgi:AcrR family transcriptional regulator